MSFDTRKFRPESLYLHIVFLAAAVLGCPAAILWAQQKGAPEPTDPNSPYFMVDLSRHVNHRLQDFQLRTQGNDLAGLLAGASKGSVPTIVLQKIPFRLDGVILVGPAYTGSSRFGSVSLEQKVEGIPVRQRAEFLFFLHATHFGEGSFGEIGSYVIHYDDEGSEKIPIRLGRDVLDWWGRSDDAIPMANLVWRGSNAAASSMGFNCIRLFMTKWKNPRAKLEIESFDMVVDGQSPGWNSPAPFLVALTGKVDEEFYPGPKQKGPRTLRKRPAP